MAKGMLEPAYPADLPPEEWRPIQGYEGLYDISSWGRVRSWVGRHGNAVTRLDVPVLRAIERCGRYCGIGLRKRGAKPKRFQIHRLVALHFIGAPPSPKHHAAHENGQSHQNWLENIRWKTAKENDADKDRHGTRPRGEKSCRHKITEAQARKIIAAKGIVPGVALAEEHGITPQAVCLIQSGKNWPHLQEKAA